MRQKLRQFIRTTITKHLNKNDIIQYVIDDLEKLKLTHNWKTVVDENLLLSLKRKLTLIKIKPLDIEAALQTSNPKKQKQYLITGPSASVNGGRGALQVLKAMLK